MNSSLPAAEKCWCGHSLKTWVIIIGAIELIIYTVIALFVALMFPPMITSMYFQSNNEKHDSILWTFIIAVYFIRMVCHIVVSSLLIHGARTGRPGFLTPWIIVHVIFFLLDVVSFVISIVTVEWISAVIGSIFIGVYLYPFFVVWSFKKQLETSNEKCPPSNKL